MSVLEENLAVVREIERLIEERYGALDGEQFSEVIGTLELATARALLRIIPQDLGRALSNARADEMSDMVRRHVLDFMAFGNRLLR